VEGPVERAVVLEARAVPVKEAVAVVHEEPAQGVQGDQRSQLLSWAVSKSQPSGQQASDSQWPCLERRCCLHSALAARLLAQLEDHRVGQLGGRRVGCRSAAGPWHRVLGNPRFGSQSLRMGRQWVAPYPPEAAEAEMLVAVWKLESRR